MESVFALQRRIGREAERAVLAWYSSDSLKNGRGSLMAYIPGTVYWPWYASWEKSGSWHIAHTKEVTVQQLADFKELGLQVKERVTGWRH